MSNKIAFDALWDESPIDVTPEVNFIWSIANKLRGSYMPDKYGDVIIPMTILRRLGVPWSRPKGRHRYVRQEPELSAEGNVPHFRLSVL